MTLFRALSSAEEENQYQGIQILFIQRWISRQEEAQRSAETTSTSAEEPPSPVAKSESAPSASGTGTLQSLATDRTFSADSSQRDLTEDELTPLTEMKRAGTTQAVVKAAEEVIAKRRRRGFATITNSTSGLSSRELAERAVNRGNRLKRIRNEPGKGKSKKRLRLTPEREAEMVQVCRQIFEEEKQKSRNGKGRDE